MLVRRQTLGDRITEIRIACGEQNGRVQFKEGWLMQGGNVSITTGEHPSNGSGYRFGRQLPDNTEKIMVDFGNEYQGTFRISDWTKPLRKPAFRRRVTDHSKGNRNEIQGGIRKNDHRPGTAKTVSVPLRSTARQGNRFSSVECMRNAPGNLTEFTCQVFYRCGISIQIV